MGLAIFHLQAVFILGFRITLYIRQFILSSSVSSLRRGLRIENIYETLFKGYHSDYILGSFRTSYAIISALEVSVHTNFLL